MAEQETPPDPSGVTPGVNPGYVLGQLAKALTTNQTHPDQATRERAATKIERWIGVLQGMFSGKLNIGSRTPLADTPSWATPEVLRGGFASGALLGAGPLLPHETALLRQLPPVEPGSERAALNSYYLGDAGFAALQALLATGKYRIALPEEGALPVVAWLAAQGRTAEARALLDQIGPFLARLRFYPAPADRPLTLSADVYLQDVAQTIDELREVKVRPIFARQREALLVWAPLYDRTVSLFLETVAGEPPYIPLDPDGVLQRKPNGYFVVAGGWPCQQYPAGWRERAQALLDEYQRQRSLHQLARKPERDGEAFAQLRAYLARCISDPAALTGRDVGLIRAILAGFSRRRGVPGSPQHQALRTMQIHHAIAPKAVELVPVLLRRMEALPQDEGIADPQVLLSPLTSEEAGSFGLPAGLAIPPTLVSKVERALAAPVEVLLERGLITSSETLAWLIPQLSAAAQVAAIEDAALRRLYFALYTAFRRRRSLLLLNLQHQVRFSELPWVKALEADVKGDGSNRDAARSVLQQVTTLALTAFPQQILPNTLLREIGTLAKQAGLDLPIVEEVAADIFMGEFSAKYLDAAQWAGKLLAGSLYERYYGIDYKRILEIADLKASRYGAPTSQAFIALCRERAGAAAADRSWSVARNGTIIEQEQILTTHNLAVLFAALDLKAELGERLDELARRCFSYIVAELRLSRSEWHANLRALKNCAYAWRQLIFFLSLLPDDQVQMFIAWAEAELSRQPESLQRRFRPAFDGLAYAASGAAIELPARRFLGWTTDKHWLMPEERKH